MSYIGNNNMEKNPKYSEIKSYGKKEVGREGRRERETVSRKRGWGGVMSRKAGRKESSTSLFHLLHIL